jgi:hypothetical protein
LGYGGRSDAELVQRSQAGIAPAFAVLLHRHGPAVRSAVRHDPDPTGAVIEAFVRAMRELPDRDPAAPVRPWLLALAGTDRTPDPIVPLSEEERDEIWAELALRWPNGRPPRRWEALRRVALVAGLIAVSALVPTLVLLAGEDTAEPVDELRAFPLQSTVEVVETEPPEPLPSFTFPAVPELEGPAAADPAPTPTTTPTPEPTPTAAPAATPGVTPTAPPPAAPSPSPAPTEPAAEAEPVVEPVEPDEATPDPGETLPIEPPESDE